MRNALITCITVSLLLLLICVYETSAEEGLFSLTKDVNYDITVQLSREMVSKIKNVRVVGTVEVAGKAFLIVELQGEIKTVNCLIILDSIKTILPVNTSHESLIQYSSSS